MSDSKSNIKFNYLYRDGGNYKVWGSEVFSNPDSLSFNLIEDRIKQALIEGEFFNPKYWKLNRLQLDDWDVEIDHTWNEFDSIEITEKEPTVDFSITDFFGIIAKSPNTNFTS